MLQGNPAALNQVGMDEVGENLDVQVHAFLGQGRFDEFEDFRVRHRGALIRANVFGEYWAAQRFFS